MNNCYIIAAKRTPIGKYGGCFLNFPAVDLTAITIKSCFDNFVNFESKVNQVILGNVLSAGLGQNPARIASIKSNIPYSVPALTINQVCASGLSSVIWGAQSIILGDSNIIVAGGMENMSQCPYYLNNYRFGVKFGSQNLVDGVYNDGLYCRLVNKHMGLTAENIAKKYKISRNNQDQFAYESHQKAIIASDSGIFDYEIVPVKIPTDENKLFLNKDEQIRRDTDVNKLSKLKPCFKKGGTVTAGNSSSINDGAAVVLLASEKMVKIHKIKPLALIKSYATIGVNPNFMGMGAYKAAKKCLQRINMNASGINLWEINEAFACQCLAVIRELKIDPKKVNVNGGAIALGHPIGASGARILTTLIYELKRRKQKYGCATLCVGGGQGAAIIVENIE